mmetsp:Transcript_5195/g.9767  ORF Transcript_5195/g.9767 Transcript_5195/m.9767 type:complete len:274 (-) Transcript_5195:151-972(-)
MHPLGKLLGFNLDAAIAIPAFAAIPDHPTSLSGNQTVAALRLLPVSAVFNRIEEGLALLVGEACRQVPGETSSRLILHWIGPAKVWRRIVAEQAKHRLRARLLPVLPADLVRGRYILLPFALAFALRAPPSFPSVIFLAMIMIVIAFTWRRWRSIAVVNWRGMPRHSGNVVAGRWWPFGGCGCGCVAIRHVHVVAIRRVHLLRWRRSVTRWWHLHHGRRWARRQRGRRWQSSRLKAEDRGIARRWRSRHRKLHLTVTAGSCPWRNARSFGDGS